MVFKYTVYDVNTGKIIVRSSHIPRDGLPEGQDWIAGDVDDVFYRIDPKTGEPYPFIEQDQFPWLIRRKCRQMLAEIGATDNDIKRWIADREMFEISETVRGMSSEQFTQKYRELLRARQRILDAAERLMQMDPIPQDALEPSHWE